MQFSRPAKLNAINIEMANEIHLALDQISQDKKCYALIITGSGKGFCSGWDVSENTSDTQNIGDYNITNISQHITEIPQPVIAAINGITTGIGLSIALAADIRIATDDSKFSSIFVKRSLVPDGGATLMLQKLLGRGIAMEMALTGNIYNAKWALNKGLVNQIVPAKCLLTSATEMGTIIVNNPPSAVRETKNLINRLSGILTTVIRSENDANLILMETKDFQESLRAFIEKRPPIYKDN